MKFSRTIAAAALSISGTTTMLATSASASATTSIQEQIEVQLRSYPDGIQTGPNEISYAGGKVTITFPNPDQPYAADTCAASRYCFYDGANFSGRKLTFADCGSSQYFSDYGFENKTSSWSNHTKYTVDVFDSDVQPWKLLWTENPHAASTNVGTTAYNKANFFTTYCA